MLFLNQGRRAFALAPGFLIVAPSALSGAARRFRNSNLNSGKVSAKRQGRLLTNPKCLRALIPSERHGV